MIQSLNLASKTSISEDKLQIQILGLEQVRHLAIRSEGKLKTSNLQDTFTCDLTSPFFTSCGFNSNHLGGDRLCLALLMAFTPTFSALCSDEVQRTYFNIQDFPDFEVTLFVDFEVSDELKTILRKEWMFPRLNIRTFANTSIPATPIETHKFTSVAWGGGLDSTAALIVFEDMPNCTPYVVDQDSPQLSAKVESLKHYGFEINRIKTNIKSLYQDGGWPMWTSPTIPALIRGDAFCFPGTTSGSFLSDGLRYKPHRNLWLDALNIAGMSLSMAHCVSEYLTAQIVHSRGLARVTCGENCSEWGVSYKALRKALYMASLDDTFIDDVLFLENEGLSIDFDNSFSERSKFSMDISEAAHRLRFSLHSTSLSNILPKIRVFRQDWILKAPLSEDLSFVDLDSRIYTYLYNKFNRLGIEIMSQEDIENFKSFDYEKLISNL